MLGDPLDRTGLIGYVRLDPASPRTITLALILDRLSTDLQGDRHGLSGLRTGPPGQPDDGLTVRPGPRHAERREGGGGGRVPTGPNRGNALVEPANA